MIANNLTLNNVSLTTLYSLDQVVNVNNTTSNIVIISNTTPSTSMSTGCLQLSGGLGVNGNVYAQEFVNTNAGGWRLTHTHSTRPTVNGATVGGELTGGNGDVETGFLRLSGGGSTTARGHRSPTSISAARARRRILPITSRSGSREVKRFG